MRSGPGSADVERVDVDEEEPEGLRRFEVRDDLTRPAGGGWIAPAMATAAVRSEPQAQSAAPAAAQARAASASTVRQAILSLQRTAGNAAVARAIAPQSIQRCGGGNCGCTSCGSKEEDLLDERMGAGLLRSAVARRSAAIA